MAIKVQFERGMAWSMAFSQFLQATFNLTAFTPSGVECIGVCTKHLALRVKTLKGRLPIKDKSSESKGREAEISTVDWANATGKKSTLSAFEKAFALVLKDYGDYTDYGLSVARFTRAAMVKVEKPNEETKWLLPHDGTIRDLWAWAHERAIEEIAQAEAKAKAEAEAKEKAEKEKEAKPA